MIAGTVTADYDAVISLVVRGPTGKSRRVRAVVDTGYNCWLTLPRWLITELKLVWVKRSPAILANGKEDWFDRYRAMVLWNRNSRDITVDASDTEALVGMALLRGFELNVQVRRGGKVRITKL